ncbi:MAG: hypothetical protein CV087_22255 [Candidatus Brocadia sp. WS118]|nr:MAG: hypothetical protein CV087_22255 [Candidatus Brocadia sp. WS118]
MLLTVSIGREVLQCDRALRSLLRNGIASLELPKILLKPANILEHRSPKPRLILSQGIVYPCSKISRLPLSQEEQFVPGLAWWNLATTSSPKEELRFNPFNRPYPLFATWRRSPDNLIPALQTKPCLPPIPILPITKEALCAGISPCSTGHYPRRKIILPDDTAGELQIAPGYSPSRAEPPACSRQARLKSVRALHEVIPLEEAPSPPLPRVFKESKSVLTETSGL